MSGSHYGNCGIRPGVQGAPRIFSCFSTLARSTSINECRPCRIGPVCCCAIASDSRCVAVGGKVVVSPFTAVLTRSSSDGGLGSLRALLDQLDRRNIEVEGLTVHTPDLDDVFFALTGHPITNKDAAR